MTFAFCVSSKNTVMSDELQNWPVREIFIVRRPVHRGNPTLSAWEVLIQWHGELLRRETARLQWMSRTSLGATSCSRRSNDTCCHHLHNCWIFRCTFPLVPPEVWPRMQLGWRSPILTHRGFGTRRLPSPGLTSSPKPVPSVWPLLHATASGSHRWELSARGGPVADELS